MKILIPAGKAIQILQTRLREIDLLDFNPKAWKNRTENDLREIFPLGSIQWLQVSQIQFDTFITSDKAKALANGKETAKQLIISYIDFIKEYSQIEEQRERIKEKDFEQKYYDSLKERDELAIGYNKLLEEYDEHLTSSDKLIDEIEAKENEIERIKSESIQIDNVSFSKFTKAFFNLPVWQIITTFSIVIAIIIGVFKLGTIYQKNEDNNLMFNLNIENTNLKNERELSNQLILKKDAEIQKTKNLIDSLTQSPKSKKPSP